MSASRTKRVEALMIVDFHAVFCPTRLPRAKTRRAQQKVAKQYRLPIARIGHSVVIDDVAGDAALLRHALHQHVEAVERRGPGRPRKGAG
jgi:hypothetical protein